MMTIAILGIFFVVAMGAGLYVAGRVPGTANWVLGGIAEAARHLLAEVLDRHVVGAGGDEEEAARLHQGGRQPGQLAVAARRLVQLLLRLHEGRRIGDDDVEPLALAMELL